MEPSTSHGCTSADVEKVSVLSLSDDCLARVFSKCNLDERLAVLPLVCRRFARCLAAPSCAWESLDIEVDKLCAVWDAEPFDAAQLQLWFQRRGSCVQSIQVCGDRAKAHSSRRHALCNAATRVCMVANKPNK